MVFCPRLLSSTWALSSPSRKATLLVTGPVVSPVAPELGTSTVVSMPPTPAAVRLLSPRLASYTVSSVSSGAAAGTVTRASADSPGPKVCAT